MTKDDFESWKEWAVTKEIKAFLERRKLAALERQVEIGFENNVETVAMHSARTSGIVAGINEVIDLEYEDLTYDS